MKMPHVTFQIEKEGMMFLFLIKYWFLTYLLYVLSFFCPAFEVNFMDDVGQTLLNWASAFGTQEMVSCSLKHYLVSPEIFTW